MLDRPVIKPASLTVFNAGKGDERMSVFDLTGETAVVTGAGRGIGEGIAKVLANAAPMWCAQLEGSTKSSELRMKSTRLEVRQSLARRM